MQAHKLVQDCMKKLDCDEFDVFLKSFQCNVKTAQDDVRLIARHAYENWLKDNIVPTITGDFCINVLSNRIKLIKKAG